MFTIFTSFLGSFWYIRNYRDTEDHNPVSPYNLRAEFRLFPSINPNNFQDQFVKNTAEWLIFPFIDSVEPFTGSGVKLYSIIAGFGPQFISLMVPSFIFFILHILVNKKAHKILFVLPIFSIFLIFIHPVFRQPRFYFPLIGLSTMFVSYTYDFVKSSTIKTIFKFLMIFCLIFSVVFSVPLLFDKYSKNFSESTKNLIETSNWLSKNSKGVNIAYSNINTPFLLYGSNFKNNVTYIPPTDYDSWKSKILNERVGYFVINLVDIEKINELHIKPEFHDFPLEFSLVQDTNNFEKVFSTESTEVYKIIDNFSSTNIFVLDIGDASFRNYSRSGWYSNEMDEAYNISFAWSGNNSFSSNIIVPLNKTDYTIYIRAHPFNLIKDSGVGLNVIFNNKSSALIAMNKDWKVYNTTVTEENLKTGNNLVTFVSNFSGNLTPRDNRTLAIKFDYIVFVPIKD
ncbi:MAG: hypothetical protein J4428_02755 [Candidatus Aenigmarchaeota archaeon]|nr:hypothetical protein [Candidatus Aenigmarchaeota archaeon]